MTRVIKRREKMARRSRINTDVKPVRKIDIVNASKDELIEYLCQTINYEVEKGDDADCDLIRECSDWLDELTSDVISFTPEELNTKLDAIKRSNSTCISCPVPTTHTSHIAKRKVFARVTILVASLILLSLLSLSVMAKYEGYNTAWEYVVSNVNKLFGLESGENLNTDGITFWKYSESINYSNIDELVANESIEVLYPRIVPNNNKIIEVRFLEETEEHYTLCFVFSEESYVFNVSNYYHSNLTKLDNFECLTINDLKFYYTIIDENTYFALLQYNGFEYTIQSSSYDDLLVILKSMKG